MDPTSELETRMVSKAQAVAAVRDYTGDPTLALKAHADPKVDGCWALQDAEGNGYLIQGNLGHAPTGDDVEEVEYTSWPPRSGAPRFVL